MGLGSGSLTAWVSAEYTGGWAGSRSEFGCGSEPIADSDSLVVGDVREFGGVEVFVLVRSLGAWAVAAEDDVATCEASVLMSVVVGADVCAVLNGSEGSASSGDDVAVVVASDSDSLGSDGPGTSVRTCGCGGLVVWSLASVAMVNLDLVAEVCRCVVGPDVPPCKLALGIEPIVASVGSTMVCVVDMCVQLWLLVWVLSGG